MTSSSWSVHRGFVVITVMFVCALSAASCAEKPSMDEGAQPYELPAGYGLNGALAREVCASRFRVGDTVSAELSRDHFTSPVPEPRHLRVVLRRDDPSRLGFASVSAEADGYLISRSIGTFTPDVESGSGECYQGVYGSLSQPLRIPRMY